MSEGQIAHVANRPHSPLEQYLKAEGERTKANKEIPRETSSVCDIVYLLLDSLLSEASAPVSLGFAENVQTAGLFWCTRSAKLTPLRVQVSSCSVVKYFIRLLRNAGRNHRPLLPRLTEDWYRAHLLTGSLELLPHKETGRLLRES